VFVCGDRVIPIECGARGGGGHIYSTIVRLVSGVDLMQLAVRLTLGERSLVRSATEPRGACYRFIFPKTGVLRSVSGVDHVLAHPGVVDLILSLAPGAEVREPEHGAQRVGCLVTHGANRGEAIQTADWAEAALQWTIS